MFDAEPRSKPESSGSPDLPIDRGPSAVDPDSFPPAGSLNTARSWGNRCISVAFLSGLVFVPMVIATGLLSERRGTGRVPADISLSSLRHSFDRASAEPGSAASQDRMLR